jgi:hypothetical protein
MIKYSRTAQRHGQAVKLYNVYHESGDIVFEVAFGVPKDQAERIARSVRRAFAGRALRIDDRENQPVPLQTRKRGMWPPLRLVVNSP